MGRREFFYENLGLGMKWGVGGCFGFVHGFSFALVLLLCFPHPPTPFASFDFSFDKNMHTHTNLIQTSEDMALMKLFKRYEKGFDNNDDDDLTIH